MCSREFIARCWYSLIFTGSTRLKTPPTGLSAQVGSPLIWPSEISWIWFSLSCSVIFLMRASTRRSTSRLAAPRVGCSAAPSPDRLPPPPPPRQCRAEHDHGQHEPKPAPHEPLLLPSWTDARGTRSVQRAHQLERARR